MEIVATIVQILAIVLFVLAMTYAAFSDLRSFEIPNWVALLVTLAFVMIAVSSPVDWQSLLPNIITGMSVLIVGFALFAARLFGAGDVKLLAAISLWIGWPHLMPYLFLVTFTGGILSIFLIYFRRYSLFAPLSKIAWIARLHAKGKDVPYAVAIALPAILYVPRIPLVANSFG